MKRISQSSSASFGLPILAFALAVAVIAAAWWWLGRPAAMPPSPLAQGEKLYCVSYAPFRGEQNPLNPPLKIEAAQIDEDLGKLARITDCVRTYAIEFGLDQIPAIARKHGLKVIQGIWLSSNAEKNRVEVETATRLAKEYPDVIRSLVVGNEVLLRGELSGPDLANTIRDVKAKAGGVPVTYADVWEFWLRHREIYDAVDFVTIHILPYWEDFPISAQASAGHIDSIRRRMVAAFPDKEILIGETGFPSEGRMREGALPSPVNQARVLHDVLALAKRDNFHVNLIEAFDQPWKRYLEGAVGGHWGLIDADTRQPKFAWGEALSNHPRWAAQMAGGIGFAAVIMLAAFAASARQRRLGLADWAAIGVSAAAAGVLAGLMVEKIPVESFSPGLWTRALALAAVAFAAPVLCAIALARGTAVPALSRILARGDERERGWLPLALGLVFTGLLVLAVQIALGLVFDPRYRDFPYAPLTMAVIPFAVLALRCRSGKGKRATAEAVAAVTLLASAVYVFFNEGISNWQSVWVSGLFVMLALSLLSARDGQD